MLADEVVAKKTCKCGCGQYALRYTKTRRGHRRGEYRDFMLGHNSKVVPPNYNGGVLHRNGYVYLLAPKHPFPILNGMYIKRSRFVVEQLIGRYLTTEEIVHHINMVKSDDRAENLMIVSRAEHNSIHNAGRNMRDAIRRLHAR